MIPVAIAGGGTGGHLFPGLAVAEELARRGASVSWIGARRGIEATRVPDAGFPVHLLPVTGAVGRSPAARLGAAFRTALALGAAYSLLQRLDIRAVLAVGGYAAFPGGAAARCSRIPLVVQEQNARPGLTNRVLAPWATVVACGFSEAAAALPGAQVEWTGNPVRRPFFLVGEPPPGPTLLLVLGGSQGSAFLNRLLPEALASLPARGRPQVLHQAGRAWVDQVALEYGAVGVEARVVPFLEEPSEALSKARLVVARSGALTVSELAAAGRPAILVPFAAAAHDHQTANAGVLAGTGAAVVLPESQATPGRLASLLAEMLGDPAALQARGTLGRRLVPEGAAVRIAELVLGAARGESLAEATRPVRAPGGVR